MVAETPTYTCAPASSPEPEELNIADLVFDSKLDQDYELEIVVEPMDYCVWISRSDARKIIAHLHKVFNIGP